VKEIIRQYIHRGKVYVTVSIQGENDGVLGIQIDKKTVKGVQKLLQDLQTTSGIQDDLKLDHLLKFSDIFQNTKESECTERVWQGVREALMDALNELKTMRNQEGMILIKDIKQRIKNLKKYIDKIEILAQKNVPEAYERLVKRVQKLLQNIEMDKDRLYSEIALLSDRLDVTEECVRLKSHIQIFLNTLKNDVEVGKRLNFLLQEMNRETNTISSKATHSDISHFVVGMKEEIEKLREQVQNLE
jgi:uncharacterized protein (TIGR00255 family)